MLTNILKNEGDIVTVGENIGEIDENQTGSPKGKIENPVEKVQKHIVNTSNSQASNDADLAPSVRKIVMENNLNPS